MEQLNIRLAELSDLPDIVTILNHAIVKGGCNAILNEVSVSDRREWFKSHTPNKYPIFVAELNNITVGWSSLSNYRPEREALRYTSEVSYYVHKDYQGKGIGSQLLDYCIYQCEKLETKTLVAILLDVNSTSIGLLKKFGFKQWGLLPNVVDFKGIELGHMFYGLRVRK
jgi:L-amino acid N-acyltransferase YncA